MPRPRKPSRLYYRKAIGQWVIKDGETERRTGCGYGDRGEAEKALQGYLAGRPSQRGPSQPHEITVGTVLAVYGQDRGSEVRSTGALAHSIEALAGYWGDLTCDAVKGSTCRAYAKQRARPRTLGDGRVVTAGPSTVRRELGVLQAAVNHAHREGILIYPLRVTLPESAPPRERWLTRAEAARLLLHASPHCRRFILISLYTGRRARAVLDLTWPQVDLEAGVIRFAKGAETKKRRGRARIPGRLLAHLRRWRAQARRGETHVVWDPHQWRSVDNIRRAFAGARERSRLPDVTPHVLKHTAITWAMQRGLSVEAAAEFFDTSPTTIRKHYWHHSPHHQAEAVRVIGRK